MTSTDSTETTIRTSAVNTSALRGKITFKDAEIKGTKLPTNKQVIRWMKYYQQFENLNQWESSEIY